MHRKCPESVRIDLIIWMTLNHSDIFFKKNCSKQKIILSLVTLNREQSETTDSYTAF